MIRQSANAKENYYLDLNGEITLTTSKTLLPKIADIRFLGTFPASHERALYWNRFSS